MVLTRPHSRARRRAWSRPRAGSPLDSAPAPCRTGERLNAGHRDRFRRGATLPSRDVRRLQLSLLPAAYMTRGPSSPSRPDRLASIRSRPAVAVPSVACAAWRAIFYAYSLHPSCSRTGGAAPDATAAVDSLPALSSLAAVWTKAGLRRVASSNASSSPVRSGSGTVRWARAGSPVRPNSSRSSLLRELLGVPQRPPR